MESLLIPFLVATIICFLMTPVVIKLAKRFGFMDIPKDNRRMHNKPIPLSGGLAMYITLVVSILIFVKLGYISLSTEIIGLIVGSSVIVVSGLIDDKVGLSPKKKIVFQLVAGICLVLGGVRIDFFNNPFGVGDPFIYIKYLSIPITLFWITGITNTINLIDGLDGLAAGVSMICSISLMCIAYKFGFTEVTIIAAILAGACLGFLPFNFNPAKIFMGDTGSLAIGGAIATIAIILEIPLLIPVVGGIYVLETLSVIIQVTSFKLTGKRIFKMAPIHHHFEQCGWSEVKIVTVFSIVTVILCMIGFWAL